MDGVGKSKHVRVPKDEKKMICEWIWKNSLNEFGMQDYVWSTRGKIVSPKEIHYQKVVERRPDKPWKVYRVRACEDRFGGVRSPNEKATSKGSLEDIHGEKRLGTGDHDRTSPSKSSTSMWASHTTEPVESLSSIPACMRTGSPDPSSMKGIDTGSPRPRSALPARKMASDRMTASEPGKPIVYDTPTTARGLDNGRSILVTSQIEKAQIRKWLARNQLDPWGKTTSVLTLKRPVFSRFGEDVQYDYIAMTRPSRPWKSLKVKDTEIHKGNPYE